MGLINLTRTSSGARLSTPLLREGVGSGSSFERARVDLHTNYLQRPNFIWHSLPETTSSIDLSLDFAKIKMGSTKKSSKLLAIFLVMSMIPSGNCFSMIPCRGVQSRKGDRHCLEKARMHSAPELPSRMTRREAILASAFTAGFLALGASQPASALPTPPSAISAAQGGVQAAISPGHWLGQFIGVNSHTETWELGVSPEVASKALTEALEQITPPQQKSLLFEHLDIQTSTPERLRVLTWTKSEWLDVLDVKFRPMPDGKGCIATVSIYATGFLPTSIPLAPLINIMLFFFPFVSPNPGGGLLQNNRCQILYTMLRSRLPKQK